MGSKGETPNPARKLSRISPVKPRSVKSETNDEELVSRRRDELIRAAIEVFGEKGFHGATVRDIGRAANMTQGTIYNYVQSKDDILYLVCDRVVSTYLERVRSALVTPHRPVDRVRFAVRAIATVICEYRSEIRLIYRNTYLLEPKSQREISSRMEQFIELFEQLLVGAGREMKISIPHPHVFANILTYLPGMIALRGWSLRGELNDEELVSEITEFLIRGLALE